MPHQTHSSTATGDPTAAAADLPSASTATTAKAQKQAISGVNIIEAKSKKVQTTTNTEEDNNNGGKGRKAKKGRKQVILFYFIRDVAPNIAENTTNSTGVAPNTAKSTTTPTGVALNIAESTTPEIIDHSAAPIIAGTSTTPTDVAMESPPHTPLKKIVGGTAEDVIMMSPTWKKDDLKGASQVTGGLFCGNSPVFETGEVQYFVSDQNPGDLSIADMNPVLIEDTPISQTIWLVLESLSQKYSPVKGSQHHANTISHAQTPHTTITAVSDDESDQEEKPIPRLKLAQLLGVNECFLSDASQKHSGLPIAYGCYKAYLNAYRAFDQLTASGKWPSKYKLPVEEDIIQLFIGKTTFYENYCRLFSKISDYPKMLQWLNGETPGSDDEDIDVWAGYNKK
ncbi:hypothetical protein BDQ12DRAFT_729097 [Crucibulum laeve]|uniref:Uncharacterized protein n=1 Tax=Crucibulum laeve TaxID=68775 RepID=A0A5C3LGL7_9AGAR|nr:hypothetical protein BDQ12DRAFT_729097 [Crucibulum laeve]